MTGVKSSENMVFTARRADDYADVSAIYNEDITIDKASAPNATPYYRSMESDDFFYDGSRICFMRVPLKQGKKTRVVFERTFKAPEQFCRLGLWQRFHTLSSTTVIKVPAALAGRIYVKPYRFREGMTLNADTLPDGAIHYTITATDIAPLRKEPGAPSPAISEPHIMIGGYFADTDELYSHLASFVSEPEDYGADISALAAELRAKAADDQSLIDTTAAWVRHNIRYLAIEHGEYGVRPAEASQVLAHKAGDCKGSANLIKALLKSNGIDARLVWIGTEGKIATGWTEFPALSSGNHMIAAAMLGDSIIYLDGTTAYCPPGYLPPWLRRRSVLIENGDRPLLSSVPDACRERDTDTLVARFRIDGTELKGSIERRASGVIHMALQQTLSNMPPREHAAFVDRYLRYPKKSVSVNNTDIHAPRGAQSMTIRADVTEAASAMQLGDRILLDLKPIRSTAIETVSVKDRRQDYCLPISYTSVYDYIVEIPEGYRPEQLPEPFSINDEWLRADIEYSFSDGRIICRAMCAPASTYVPLRSLDQRNASVRALLRASDTRIALIPE